MLKLAFISHRFPCISCTVQENTNLASISIRAPGKGSLRRRRLGDGGRNSKKQRKLENGNFEMNVLVSNCLFLDNTIWPYSGATIEGLLKIQNAKVEVSHSVFMGNKIKPDERVRAEQL